MKRCGAQPRLSCAAELDAAWDARAKGLLKAELVRKGVTYEQLAENAGDEGKRNRSFDREQDQSRKGLWLFLCCSVSRPLAVKL